MTLREICDEIVEVYEGLVYNEIPFSYDSLMSAMKPGHPADILDDILEPISDDVLLDNPIDDDRLVLVLGRLEEFMKCFKIRELSKPIKHLKEFIKEIDN